MRPPSALALRIEAADDATLERTQGVVIEHLKRFAFREDLGEVQWTRGRKTGGTLPSFRRLSAPDGVADMKTTLLTILARAGRSRREALGTSAISR